MDQTTQGKSTRKCLLLKKQASKPSRTETNQGTKYSTKTLQNASTEAKSTSKSKLHQYSMFQSTTCYVLDGFNSIAYVNHRIYDLMKLQPRSLWGKALKCNCSKSKCEAKYCQCFSRHQVCSNQCSCIGCNNNQQSRYDDVKPNKQPAFDGCRCSKSKCIKNYCQCFQRGEFCDQKCKCANCRNGL